MAKSEYFSEYMQENGSAYSRAESLVFYSDLLTHNQWVTAQFLAIHICVTQINCGDLGIFVGGVIVNSVVGVATTGVDGFLITFTDLCTAPLLRYRLQNMKKLTDV